MLGALGASTAALVGSGLILTLGRRAERAAGWLFAYAVGTLLAAAVLGLLPEALEHAPPMKAMWLFLAGMLGFIFFERALRWRHHAHRHHGEGSVERTTAVALLWGDALHNFIDGLVLGVSFGVSSEVGTAAAVAIFAHEVPQEIGDFAILLEAGMPKRRAMLLNYLSGLTPVPGALLAFAGASSPAVFGVLLPLAAGGFVYIALAGLVPALQHRKGRGAGLLQLGLVLLGVATVWAVGQLSA
ncbi:MAG: ZIP family metal transporter [Myxococcales bacterium]|nr:ZIP family metal transporter [Myxococcales bacterium]